jgi:hypothetical protein
LRDCRGFGWPLGSNPFQSSCNSSAFDREARFTNKAGVYYRSLAMWIDHSRRLIARKCSRPVRTVCNGVPSRCHRKSSPGSDRPSGSHCEVAVYWAFINSESSVPMHLQRRICILRFHPQSRELAPTFEKIFLNQSASMLKDSISYAISRK